MVLLYLRLPDRPVTVPASENAENRERKPQPHRWLWLFRLQRNTPKASPSDQECRKLNSRYHLERRFLL